MRTLGPGLWAPCFPPHMVLGCSLPQPALAAHQTPETYQEVLPRVSKLLQMNHAGECWLAARWGLVLAQDLPPP